MTGRSPAAIIVARHGARLDAADDSWHLTSPTPYDPPLTYGGWTQARALGWRIGDLLQTQTQTQTQPPVWEGAEYDAQGSRSRSESVVGVVGEEGINRSSSKNSTAGNKNKKYRVVVHSSPFLRCVQTAIGLSSGISQARSSGNGNGNGNNQVSSPTTSPSAEAPEPEPEAESEPEPEPEPTAILNQRSLLRLDAFLGEWLTPDYFEHITPPPGSFMMLASAKGELLRRGETTVNVNSPISRKASLGHFPGGWNRTPPESTTPTEKKPDEETSWRNSNGHGRDISESSLPQHEEGYIPPTPTFAISPSDPIPPGYVAHARDACVQVDYQWDSMKEPLSWGTGGEYGEEWSAMHRRFRTGLERMIQWYKSEPELPSDSDRRQKDVDVNDDDDDDDDDDIETVVVLVTHGAGCNALIGALTKRPALIDVAMASLTVAVRKDEDVPSPAAVNSSENTSPTTDSNAADVIDDYEMRLVASTDHLRLRSNVQQQPPQQQQQRDPSPRGSFTASPMSSSSYRRRLESAPGTLASSDSFSVADATIRDLNSNNSNAQQQQQQQQYQQRAPHPVSRAMSVNRPSSGLWGSAVAASSDAADDILPNFEGPRPASSSRRNSPPHIQEHVAEEKFQGGGPTATTTIPLRGKSPSGVAGTAVPSSQHGLWRSPSSSSSRSRDRESAFTKRRWTMADRAT